MTDTLNRYETRIAGAVQHAIERMGVTLIRCERIPTDRGWMNGPAGPSLNPSTRSIWADSRDDDAETWFQVLHELEHLVFWRDEDPDLSDSVEQLMMPWGVSTLRAAGIPAALYMRSPYNNATAMRDLWIGNRRYDEVGSWKRPLRSAWYLRARAANIAAGTIDASGLPTWRRPDWSKINIEEHRYP